MAERVFLACESRALGTSEANIVKALEGGTGITVRGILFGQTLSICPLRAALLDVLSSQPLLRSHIIHKEGKLWLHIPKHPNIHIDLVHTTENEGLQQIQHVQDGIETPNEGIKTPCDGIEAPNEEINTPLEKIKTPHDWTHYVEEEINTPYPAQLPHQAFQARLYLLPSHTSLLILRLHPSATDFLSGSLIATQLFSSLQHYIHLESIGQLPNDHDGNNDVDGDDHDHDIDGGHDEDVAMIDLPCIEDGIPPGQCNKPFWARGIDVVGYGLVSRRHAFLPFNVPGKPTRSCLIRSALSTTATTKLLEACKQGQTDTYGVLMAASLKAVTDFKEVGNRGEHYGIVCLLNCRKLLQPPIPDSSVGCYHAGMMRTIHATQAMGLMDLAKKCTCDFNEAVKNRKQFTDLADLNMLMVQAMAHPNLTHAGSMRTALISSFYEPVLETVGETEKELKVMDWVTGMSFHGVGACLALLPGIRDGALQITYVYCEPLFTRSTAQSLVDSIFNYLSKLS